MLTRRSPEAVLGRSLLRVSGGGALSGVANVSGFKHALVSVMAAACGVDGRVTITNCPDILETKVLASLIEALGGRVVRSGSTLRVEAAGCRHGRLDSELARQVHGSVYLLPALAARFGTASVDTGGGCPIGSGDSGRRPVRHYVEVFERFGAAALVDSDGHLSVSARRLTGCDVDLLNYTSDPLRRTGPLYSGASKLALLCAAYAHGRSTLRNLYPKPDVTELVDFLRAAGVEVEGSSVSELHVTGVGTGGLAADFHVELPADLIEVITWVCAGATLSSSKLSIRGDGLERAWGALQPERSLLERMGVAVVWREEELVVSRTTETEPVEAIVSSTGIYSDVQPMLALLAARCRGETLITETVWTRRFDHVDGLNALGTRIERAGATLRIHGGHTPRLPNQRLRSTDIRSAATLLLAALEVEGETILDDGAHLARGYADLPASLRRLGACIEHAYVE